MLSIKHKPQHRCTIEFNTFINQKTLGHEQRQARWFNPKRTFEISFENTPDNTQAIESFHEAKKGNYELFYWNWVINGLDYKCFMDNDNLSLNILENGYSTGSLRLITVDEGNILKNRYLTSAQNWLMTGNISIISEKAVFSSASTLSQSNVLTTGEDYLLEVFCENLSGTSPKLSTSTSSGTEADRTIVSGKNTIEFTASGNDFIVETQSGSSGEFRDFLLYPKYQHQNTLNIDHKVEHIRETRFKTLSDSDFTHQNNRRTLWDNPIKRWTLTFNLMPQKACELADFFISQKGCYKGFSWNDGTQNHTVRFDSDSLTLEFFELGYAKAEIPIIQLRS